ncbi:MAG: hypothetical protein MJ078_08845, partial [Clostridia bacterium]|nr:hypothetical protein [Clostridia bacterium]
FRPKRNRPKKRFSGFDTPSKCVSPNVFRGFVKSAAQKTGKVQHQAHIANDNKTPPRPSRVEMTWSFTILQPLSTTEVTEAAFAGTEAVWERKPKRLFNHNTTTQTCGRFEHFFDTHSPLPLHLPYVALSKKFKATALGIEKRSLGFPKEIPLPFTILKHQPRAI